MEITGLELFFILKLDDFIWLFVAMGFVFGFLVVGAVARTAFCLSQDPDDWVSSSWKRDAENAKNAAPFWVKASKKLAVAFTITVFLAVLIPTTKQMAAILIVPSVIKNEKIQKLPDQLLDVLGLTLNAVKKELGVNEDKK